MSLEDEAAELFEQVQELRPMLNVGCLFDIPTGRYYTGKNGESILNGGHALITGVCGRGNSYKSTLTHWFNLTVVSRQSMVNALIYDTEYSLSNARINQLAEPMINIGGTDLFNPPRVRLTDGVTMGNAYWDNIRTFAEKKAKMGKKARVTTPFIVKGKSLTMLTPTAVEIDSMSQMQFDATETINDKAQADSKDQNALALRDNLIKSRILGQMPGVTNKGGLFTTVVAHMGDDLSLDPSAPPEKKLSTMKQKIKFKKVPENFTFLTNNLYYCSGAKPHLNADKTPYYPKDAGDRAIMDKDLQIVQVQNLRGKSGPSGVPIAIIVSQTQGLLPSLTELNYLREKKVVGTNKHPMGFGLDGTNLGYFCELYPDGKMSRTTARGAVNDDYKLRRALEITSEMCQMQLLWKDLDAKYKITPGDLRTKLIEKGYDWDILLETRGYWIFEEANDPRPFLSTMDMLKMYHDEYKPYWMK